MDLQQHLEKKRRKRRTAKRQEGKGTKFSFLQMTCICIAFHSTFLCSFFLWSDDAMALLSPSTEKTLSIIQNFSLSAQFRKNIFTPKIHEPYREEKGPIEQEGEDRPCPLLFQSTLSRCVWQLLLRISCFSSEDLHFLLLHVPYRFSFLLPPFFFPDHFLHSVESSHSPLCSSFAASLCCLLFLSFFV